MVQIPSCDHTTSCTPDDTVWDNHAQDFVPRCRYYEYSQTVIDQLQDQVTHLVDELEFVVRHSRGRRDSLNVALESLEYIVEEVGRNPAFDLAKAEMRGKWEVFDYYADLAKRDLADFEELKQAQEDL